jgi:hypothetical protein
VFYFKGEEKMKRLFAVDVVDGVKSLSLTVSKDLTPLPQYQILLS